MPTSILPCYLPKTLRYSFPMSFVKKQHIFPGTKQPPRFSDPFRAYRCVRLIDRDVDGDVARLVDVDPWDAYNRRVLRWQPAFEAATKNRVISHPTNWQILPGCFTSNEKKNPKEYGNLAIFWLKRSPFPAFPKKLLGPPVDNEEVHSITSSPVMAMVFNVASHVEKCL